MVQVTAAVRLRPARVHSLCGPQTFVPSSDSCVFPPPCGEAPTTRSSPSFRWGHGDGKARNGNVPAAKRLPAVTWNSSSLMHSLKPSTVYWRIPPNLRVSGRDRSDVERVTLDSQDVVPFDTVNPLVGPPFTGSQDDPRLSLAPERGKAPRPISCPFS